MDAALMERTPWYPPSGVICGSGLSDALLTTCLSDFESRVVVEKYTLPSDFVKYNHRWVVRDEAIALLSLLVSRCLPGGGSGGSSGITVATVSPPPNTGSRAALRDELLSLIQKYDVVASERGRLWRFKNIRLQKTVVTVLRLLLTLGPGRGGTLDRTLVRDAGIPTELIELEHRHPERSTEIAEAWRTWRTTMWKTRGGTNHQVAATSKNNTKKKTTQGSSYIPETKTDIPPLQSSSRDYETKELEEKNDDDDDYNINEDKDYDEKEKSRSDAVNTAKRLVADVESGMHTTRTSAAASKSLSSAIGRSDALSVRLTVQAASLAVQSLASSQPEGHPQAWAREVLSAISRQSGVGSQDGQDGSTWGTWFVRTVYGPTNEKKTLVPRPVGRGAMMGKARGRATLEKEMLGDTGWRNQQQQQHGNDSLSSTANDVGRMVVIHLRVSPAASKEIWRTCRNGRMKLGGIGAKDGRVRRVILVEIEGMSSLTGNGDLAPTTLTNAVRATMSSAGSTDRGTDSSRTRGMIETHSNELKATGVSKNGVETRVDEENFEDRYPAPRVHLKGTGSMRNGSQKKTRVERLIYRLEREQMSNVLRRLGERVVDVKDAFDALSLGRSQIPTSALTKLFWTCGIDDAATLVRDYERGCVAVYGDVASGVTYDDILRLYDYHEMSMLSDGDGGTGRSSGSSNSSSLRMARMTSGETVLSGGSSLPENANTTTNNNISNSISQFGSSSAQSQEWNMTGSSASAGRNAADPREATLRIAFDKYDVDKDGYISFVDLRTRFRDMGRTNVPDVEIRRWIADKDRRGKGNVNFAEFRRAYSHVIASASSGGGARLGGTVSAREMAERTMGRTNVDRENNRNDDGRTTQRGLDEGGMTQSEVREYKDKITEGRRATEELERKEEQEIQKLFNNNQDLAVRARAAFDKFDRGGNGYISSEQLKYVFETLGYRYVCWLFFFVLPFYFFSPSRNLSTAHSFFSFLFFSLLCHALCRTLYLPCYITALQPLSVMLVLGKLSFLIHPPLHQRVREVLSFVILLQPLPRYVEGN